MTRILVAECKQEVSTFNPVPSGYDDFQVLHGQQLFDYHRPLRDEVGGALSVLDAVTEVDLAPTFAARAITSGGMLEANAWSRLAEQFLESLAAAATAGSPPEAAYFALHGAMAAENELDPEGHLLLESRQILGAEVPIVVSLDLHGILTDRMLQNSAAVVVYHTYPHVDFFETGARAARVLLDIVQRGARPTTTRVKIPALVRGDELITATGALGECVRLAQQIEAQPSALSAGMLIGNPFTDVPELCSSSLVVTNGDHAAAEQAATDLAELFWQHHEKMQMPLVSLSEAIRLAAGTAGTTVLMDAADATSSGASGDSNAIVRELVETGYTGRALMPIVDPPAVQQAFAAGVGGRFRAQLGGALDRSRFNALELEVQVKLLSDGHFQSETFAQHWYSGQTAVLQAGAATIVAISRPVSLYDRALYWAHGQDPARFDLVVVKSPHCEPHMYADWCGRLINVDAPGSTSANLPSLGHTRCRRPMFPLDDGVRFTPQADRF